MPPSFSEGGFFILKEKRTPPDGEALEMF